MNFEKRDLQILDTVIFLAVALVHLTRLALQLPVRIGSFSVPLLLSVAGFIIASALAWLNWKTIDHPTAKTAAKVLLGLMTVDFTIVIGSWFYKLSFLGINGNLWAGAAAIDLAIIGILYWYIKK